MDNRLAEARNFLDLNGLNAIRVQAKSDDKEGKKAALQEAAQQFEAIFMKMLLKSMRKAEDVLAADSPFNTESTKFYRDMHDQQLAVDLSSSGSLGLSDLIVRQLGGESDNFTPRTLLRNDGNLDSARKNAQSALNYDEVKVLDSKAINEQASNNGQSSSPFAVFQNDTMSKPDFQQPKDFVSALIEPAKKVEKELGIPFSVVIAQAALETGWGKKIIQHPDGRSSNNLFNIKADERWQGEEVQKETIEFEQNTMVKKTAPFRLYDSIKDSVDDYIKFLSTNDRYSEAIENSNNVEHFLQGIQKAGYATDPDYANKIMGTLRKVTSIISK